MHLLQTQVLGTCSGPPPEQLLKALPKGTRPVLLDSSDGSGWSFLAWDPDCVLEGTLSPDSDSRTRWPLSREDPGRLLEEATANEMWQPSTELPGEAWGGGWIGWMSFECGHAWESFPWTEAPSCSLPDFCFARYRKGIAFSPDGELHLCLTQELGNEELSEKTELLDSFQSLLHSCEGLSSGGEEANCEMLEGLQSSSSPESFQEKVSLLRDWIGAGELFQANLSHLMGAPFRKSPRLLYSQVRQAQETAMSAYWENEKGHALLSWSPERFLKIDGEQLQTSPIKGTAPRGLTPVEDQELIAELESNEKERAELTMIVDMARNDLGRVAKSGKVHVVSAGKVEHFSTLHHRTALVNAEWNPSQGISALFRSAFPPASVTGAPKVRALQAIAELERESRGPYCGSFGIWQPGVNRGEFSVLIRTATCMSDRLQVRVGAGIVWDSQPEKEWNETLLKARYLECATPSIQSCR